MGWLDDVLNNCLDFFIRKKKTKAQAPPYFGGALRKVSNDFYSRLSFTCLLLRRGGRGGDLPGSWARAGFEPTTSWKAAMGRYYLAIWPIFSIFPHRDGRVSSKHSYMVCGGSGSMFVLGTVGAGHASKVWQEMDGMG